MVFKKQAPAVEAQTETQTRGARLLHLKERSSLDWVDNPHSWGQVKSKTDEK